MSVTSSRVYNPHQLKETFRVYRKIKGVEFQEYFDDKATASNRDLELQKLLDESHDVKNYYRKFCHPHNLAGKGYDIGVDRILAKHSLYEGLYYPKLSVTYQDGDTTRNNTFSFSSYRNIADCVTEAIKWSFEQSRGRYDVKELTEALEWAKTDECSDHILQELFHHRNSRNIPIGEICYRFNYFGLGRRTRYISVVYNPSGSVSLKLAVRNVYQGGSVTKSKVVESYYDLFKTSALLTAMLLAYSSIGEDSATEYASYVYMHVIGEWRRDFRISVEDTEREVRDLSLNYQSWIAEVNAQGREVYGSDLL